MAAALSVLYLEASVCIYFKKYEIRSVFIC